MLYGGGFPQGPTPQSARASREKCLNSSATSSTGVQLPTTDSDDNTTPNGQREGATPVSGGEAEAIAAGKTGIACAEPAGRPAPLTR